MRNGSLIAGRYELLRLIATGGMGQVWEAMDTRLDRRVAVKLLKAELSENQEFLARFRTEARTTAALNHPGIAGVYDYGETDRGADDGAGGAPLAYLVMEMIDGDPLDAVLSRLGRLSQAQTVDLLEQTGRALQVAHTAGLVHRDVKPGNILITPTGQVKITDFGIAKAVDAAPVTKTGMVMGTAQYISPEQASGEDATAASDVYSLGVVGYECLTGKRPFTGDSPIALCASHIRDTPAPLPGAVAAPVRELIERAMVKAPGSRFPDGGAFADAAAATTSAADARTALRRTAPRLATGHTTGRLTAPRLTAPRLTARRRTAIVTAAAASAVVATVVAVLLPGVGGRAADAPAGPSAQHGATSTGGPTHGRAVPGAVVNEEVAGRPVQRPATTRVAPPRTTPSRPAPSSTASSSTTPSAPSTSDAPPTTEPSASPPPTSSVPDPSTTEPAPTSATEEHDSSNLS